MKPHERVISRFIAIYGEPKTDNPILFIDEVSKTLECYAPAVVEQVGTDVIRSSKFWPRPADIVERADAICRKIDANKFVPDPEKDLPPPTAEERARARKIMELAMAAMKVTGTREEPVKNNPMQRPAFEAMQRNSRNTHLHVDHRALTRRVTGERDE